MATNTNFYVKPEYVERGGWTNWDGNAISHGQITVGKNLGDLIAVFMGMFITLVEGGLWTILAIFIFDISRNRRHHPRSSQQDGCPPPPPLGNMDGLYHQQQTVLRNGGSSIYIASTYLKLWMTWGFLNWSNAGRNLPVMFLALLSFSFFFVAMPFITAYRLVEHQGDVVMIRSPNCGFWTTNLIDNEATGYNNFKNQSWEAMTYVDSCYEGDAESALCDKFLPQRQLPVHKEFPAFTMETQYLDSHKDFGINAPKDDRINMKRITTCAPLNINNFTKIHNGTLPGEEITSVYFGRSANSLQTYNVSNYQFTAKPGYNLDYYGNGTAYGATFEPISELQHDDADVSIILFNNNGIFIQGEDGACTDPMFSATKIRINTDPDYYLADNLITGIGCIDQYSFSNPVSGEYTKLASWQDASKNATFVDGLSRRQFAAYITLGSSQGYPGGIGIDTRILSSEALRAKKHPGLVFYLQAPIPNDQWKKEVEYWFKIGLAKMQLLPLKVAMGPPDPTIPGLDNILPLLSAGQDDLVDMICSSQKVHNPDFKNLHRFGTIVLVVVGGLLILVPALVTRLLISRLRKRDNALAWSAYGQLQLQRMAAEGAGVHGWKGLEDEVPFLDPSDVLVGDIDVYNTADGGIPHPKWIGPDQEMARNDDDESAFDGNAPTHGSGSTFNRVINL
ncbi:hypothetical protein G7Z17_g3704 [Cylindrodendrum hubeiense]|uniref:Uncharacterized protein n=1 Tax=Cylindrodendrum hubeiense TaxID=595255 RepID=A0A9P5HHG0_9HYPO|nr:hypothetical protein G7Z17_g3704 [Cylindrodendrum hubeiense]